MMKQTSVQRPVPTTRDTVVPPRLQSSQALGMASALKALADPMRLRILDLLAEQPAPLCVCEITAVFARGQPTISHHLRVLRQAGLIAGKQEGSWVYYWLTERGYRSLAFARTLS
jgi:ArsR family transcriptional regulator, arsenate/arsenite/antimonite-responsive transcriptional repressor